MADTKISAMADLAPPQAGDIIPVVRAGANGRWNISALESYLNTYLYDRYNTYADLPAATGSGIIVQVMTTTGIIGFRNLAGMYHDAGVGTWNYLGLYGRAAVEIANTPAGTIAATDVQAAINELDGDIETHKASGGAHHPAATGAVAGFMSAADKTKLDAILGTNTGDQTSIVGITGTKAQFSTAVTDGDILFVGDVTQYTDELAQDAIGAALTDSSTIDFTYDDTANTITAIVKDASLALAKLSATGTPDNTKFLRGDNTWAVPAGGGGSTVNYGKLAADYVLTSSATEQKLFDWSTNGALDLATGTYSFECMVFINTMSATSGNAAFDFLGAGTAVCDRWMWDIIGIDNNNAMNTTSTPTGCGVNSQQSPASALSAQTGTALRAMMRGTFRVTTTGTIIPSITLVTAAAAVVKTGSYFKCEKIGESADVTVGTWT